MPFQFGEKKGSRAASEGGSSGPYLYQDRVSNPMNNKQSAFSNIKWAIEAELKTQPVETPVYHALSQYVFLLKKDCVEA